MWPYVRPDIIKTYVEPHIYDYIVKNNHHQKNFLHEIAYTSATKPKRIFLGNAVDTNPYHLFFYMISRFYFFDDGGQIVYFYENKNKPYLLERALQLLPKRFLREEQMDPEYEYIEMPGCSWYVDFIDEPWIYSYVRDLFVDIWKGTAQEKGKYTFISRNRQDIPNRRILNENELTKPLKNLGFSSYVLEHMSFEQQIKLFRSSEVITGLHGAGFAWLIFCLPGTTFVEIQNPYVGIPKGHYVDIAKKCNLKYVRFDDVRNPLPDEYTNLGNEDCVINVETYISSLKKITENL